MERPQRIGDDVEMARLTGYQMEIQLKQRGAVLVMFLCLLSLSMSSMLILWNEYMELRQWLFDLG